MRRRRLWWVTISCQVFHLDFICFLYFNSPPPPIEAHDVTSVHNCPNLTFSLIQKLDKFSGTLFWLSEQITRADNQNKVGREDFVGII